MKIHMESKQVGKLYRFVDVRTLKYLLENDEMRSTTANISFSRSQNYGSNTRKNIQIKFTVDGDKLSNNHKITPYMNDAEDKLHYNEFETRVKSPIRSFSNYVVKVEIPSSKYMLQSLLEIAGFNNYEDLVNQIVRVYGDKVIVKKE